MGVPLIVAGTALQIVGNLRANFDQARGELQNAAIYREQAALAQFAKEREIGLIARDYATTYGRQTSAYARGGVDVSGSAGLMLGMTMARYAEEAFATARKYDLESKIAMMRGDRSQEYADTLRSGEYNLLQGATTVLNAASEYGRAGGSFSGNTQYYGSGPMSPKGG